MLLSLRLGRRLRSAGRNRWRSVLEASEETLCKRCRLGPRCSQKACGLGPVRKGTLALQAALSNLIQPEA
eukprot:11825330-Alexandrium_andersonii.AAC.1